jgi:hypothetical protein
MVLRIVAEATMKKDGQIDKSKLDAMEKIPVQCWNSKPQR